MPRFLMQACFLICCFLPAACQAAPQTPSPAPTGAPPEAAQAGAQTAPELQTLLEQAAAQAPFVLLVPGDLPAGFALASVEVLPGEQGGPFQVLQVYRSGELELRLTQSALKLGDDPLKSVEQTSLRGVSAYWLGLNSGVRALTWDEPDSSLALNGLPDEDLLRLAEGLRAHPGAAHAPAGPTPAPTSTPPPAPPVPARDRPTPPPTPDALQNAAEVLTGLDIYTERKASPGEGRCEWRRLMAYPTSEAALWKYAYQFFTYAAVDCYLPEGQEHWELVNTWTEQAMGYPVPTLLGWAPDSSRLYFFDEIIPDGCQPLGGFQDNLRRVDLASGAIEPIALNGLIAIRLSPDAGRVIGYQGREIGVIDLATGEQRRIPFEVAENPAGWWAGDFTWSPDGAPGGEGAPEGALFVLQYGDACFPEKNEIRRLDLQSGVVSILAEINAQVVRIQSWDEPGAARITVDGEAARLDLTTGTLGDP